MNQEAYQEDSLNMVEINKDLIRGATSAWAVVSHDIAFRSPNVVGKKVKLLVGAPVSSRKEAQKRIVPKADIEFLRRGELYVNLEKPFYASDITMHGVPKNQTEEVTILINLSGTAHIHEIVHGDGRKVGKE